MKPLHYIGIIFVFLLIVVLRLSPQQHFSKSVPLLASPSEGAGEAAPELDKGRWDSFNVLLLGIDARKDEVSRTDALILASVNFREGKVKLMSIPRDTRVSLEGVGHTKINHAHFLGELKGGSKAGTREAIQAVSNLCRCGINYYLKIDFEGFEKFVDTLGGIDVELPEPVKLTYAGKTLPAGKQRLNGSTALELVRERESLKDGDFGRQRNQAMVLKSIAAKAVEPQNLKRLPELVKKLKEEVIDMNFSESDLISLAWLVKDLSPKNVSYSQIPGKDGYGLDPLLKREVYYWIADYKT